MGRCIASSSEGGGTYAVERVGRVLAPGNYLGLVVSLDQDCRLGHRTRDAWGNPPRDWGTRIARGDVAGTAALPAHRHAPASLPVHGGVQHRAPRPPHPRGSDAPPFRPAG